MMEQLPWLILLLPLVSAATILFVARRVPNISALLSTGSALVTFVMSILFLGFGDDAVVPAYPWLWLGGTLEKGLVLEIGLQIDQLSRGMMFVVTTVGFLVHVFSLGYMRTDDGKARYFAGLSLFMFSMTGIVLANNFAMMFVFWELVGLSSYLLIGHWFQKDSAADAAKKAFITNRVGDFGFLIGILLVWAISQTVNFDRMETFFAGNPEVGSGLLAFAVICVFCGAVGKSAQLPLHVWLPDAMEGPTPVSALIHAATMVAAGVYMLARVAFLVEASELAAHVIAWVGGITALVAALMALQQDDIKRVLAYSTLSQLGYMVMAVGLLAAEAAMFHLFTHAFFKALLFLGSGSVIYACHHEQDIWKMGGLRKKMPLTFITFSIATLSLMALPWVTAGFYSKEAILAAAWHESAPLFVIAGFTAMLTAFYMTRLVLVTFFGKARTEHAAHAKESPPVMTLPLILLAIPSVIAGLPFFYERVQATAPEHHGEGSMLVLAASVITLIAGAGISFWLYKGASEDPLRIKLLARKFYIDEIYQGIIRVFQDGVATLLSIFDRYIIDGLIAQLPAYATASIGSILRRLQVGNLQGYAFLFALGVILLIWITLFNT